MTELRDVAGRKFSPMRKAAHDSFIGQPFLLAEYERQMREGLHGGTPNYFVYLIENPENKKLKIGFTLDYLGRIRQLRNECGADLRLIGIRYEKSKREAKASESNLHHIFDKSRFCIGGVKTEWFSGEIRDEALKWFNEVPI